MVWESQSQQRGDGNTDVIYYKLRRAAYPNEL